MALPTTDSTVSRSAQVSAVHPELDVAVLRLDDGGVHEAWVWPLLVASSLPTGLGIGSLVQLAGFGARADGGSSRRSFLVAEVLELGDGNISVDADGLGGACFGDSGGPLLVREDDGDVRVMALLEKGSVSCFERDDYARLDSLHSWLNEASGGDLSSLPERPHERLGVSGRCFDNRAIWFDSARLEAEVCGERVCGYQADEGGYRCILPKTDPCHGITGLGECLGGSAVRCIEGHVEESTCAQCGVECRRSPSTGEVICLASYDD